MEITEVNIDLIKQNDGIIGFASIVVDGNLYLGSIAIHKKLNSDEYRLTYPTKNIRNKPFNMFHPINKQSSKDIEQAIFKKLKDVMKKVNNHDRYNNTCLRQ